MGSENEVLIEALTAYVNEDLNRAEELLIDAVKENKTGRLCDKLAAVHLRTGNNLEALKSAEDAVKLEGENPEFLVRKGLAQYNLKQYQDALDSFTAALNLVKKGKKLSIVLEKLAKTNSRNCNAELEEDEDSSENDDVEEVEGDANEQNATRAKALQSVLTGTGFEDQVTDTSKAIYKHEYYQTTDTVILTIKARHVDPEDVKIQYSDNSVNVQIFDETGQEVQYERVFKLFANIDPDHSKHKVMSTKIELKLAKSTHYHWTDLEKPFKTGEKQKMKSAYSSKKDWNAIEKNIAKAEELEKPEGDEAMNKLFKDIYSNASEETRRAMNKSFQQSGGTVLSTNWDEVEKADYMKDRVAPDGMEWRTWEGDKIPMKEKDYGKKN